MDGGMAALKTRRWMWVVMMLVFIGIQATGSVNAQTTETLMQWVESDAGSLILRPFKNAPFPHKSRENGFQGSEKFFPADIHYTDSTVGVLVPKGFKPGDTTDFVMYFHGHQNHVAQVFSQFNLENEFEMSGLNAVLIVPQGPKDAADSSGGRLEEEPGAFEALVKEVAEFLQNENRIPTAKIGNVALSAHSGGYRVVGAILIHGDLADHIRDVLLFDATYGQLESYADWCALDGGRRLISIFTQHLADENIELISLLQKRNVAFDVHMENDLTTD
ncbi:MAG: hypothetical protein V2A74_08780, partial [bacterium]